METCYQSKDCPRSNNLPFTTGIKYSLMLSTSDEEDVYDKQVTTSSYSESENGPVEMLSSALPWLLHRDYPRHSSK